MIDLVAVRNHKIKYNDHSTIEFQSLDFYLSLAQKTIAKFGKNISGTLAKEMLSSEDAISNVASCLMMADWRWDKDRIGNHGTHKTRYSYRNQCAIWAIKSYLTRKKQKNHIDCVDTISNTNIKELDLMKIIPHSTKSPIEILVDAEDQNIIRDKINFYINPNNNILTKKQAECLKMYYFDEMTFAAIGKHYNVSREAIRQNIKRAIDKIKTHYKKNDLNFQKT